MEAKTIRLSTPIKNGEETVSEITLQPLKARHLKSIPLQNQRLSDFMVVLGHASGLPDAVLNDLSAADFLSVIEEMKAFFPDSLMTGATQ